MTIYCSIYHRPIPGCIINHQIPQKESCSPVKVQNQNNQDSTLEFYICTIFTSLTKENSVLRFIVQVIYTADNQSQTRLGTSSHINYKQFNIILMILLTEGHSKFKSQTIITPPLLLVKTTSIAKYPSIWSHLRKPCPEWNWFLHSAKNFFRTNILLWWR